MCCSQLSVVEIIWLTHNMFCAICLPYILSILLDVCLYALVMEYFYKPESVVVAEVMFERYTILDEN